MDYDGYDGVVEYDLELWEIAHREVRNPKKITCRCGANLTLWSAWANTCRCGLEYNGCGQLLAPRSQWGEETGERF